ncbi:MAG: hypothetical protein RL380_1607 [Verrucomicrobiota bacterium]
MMELKQQAVLLAALLAAGSGQAGVRWFTPTPPDQGRELSTDRPDKTESPYTVDTGHFQLESDLLNFTRDHSRGGGGDTVTETWSFATLNFKAGLRDDVDLQLVLAPYSRSRTEDRTAGTVQRAHGFGDVTVRVKKNLWGNEGGRTAFAVMPFMKFPTSEAGLGNAAVEGGLIFPLAVELPRGWGMGLMTELDWLQDDDGAGRHPACINSVTFNHRLTEKLAGYVEFFSEVSAESGAPWVGTVDFGLTYGLTKNLQLDAGVNLGVTAAADDANPFVGISWRF